MFRFSSVCVIRWRFDWFIRESSFWLISWLRAGSESQRLRFEWVCSLFMLSDAEQQTLILTLISCSGCCFWSLCVSSSNEAQRPSVTCEELCPADRGRVSPPADRRGCGFFLLPLTRPAFPALPGGGFTGTLLHSAEVCSVCKIKFPPECVSVFSWDLFPGKPPGMTPFAGIFFLLNLIYIYSEIIFKVVNGSPCFLSQRSDDAFHWNQWLLEPCVTMKIYLWFKNDL